MKKRKLLIGLAVAGALLLCCIIVGLFGPKTAPSPRATDTPTPAETAISPTPTPIPPTPTVTSVPPTPAPTLSSEAQLQLAIEKALGPSNRETVERVSDFSMDTGPESEIFVEWAINDNLTEGLIKSGTQMDIADILEAIDKSGLKYGSVHVEGTFSMVDQYGNVSEMVVVSAIYMRATIERINWENFLWDNVYAIADEVWVHPVFQK